MQIRGMREVEGDSSNAVAKEVVLKILLVGAPKSVSTKMLKSKRGNHRSFLPLLI